MYAYDISASDVTCGEWGFRVIAAAYIVGSRNTAWVHESTGMARRDLSSYGRLSTNTMLQQLKLTVARS